MQFKHFSILTKSSEIKKLNNSTIELLSLIINIG